MDSIGLFAAKTHLSELVSRAERGEEVIITRHNKPVAKLVAVTPMNQVSPAMLQQRLAAVQALQAVGRDMQRRGGPITSDEIVSWVREGRR